MGDIKFRDEALVEFLQSLAVGVGGLITTGTTIAMAVTGHEVRFRGERRRLSGSSRLVNVLLGVISASAAVAQLAVVRRKLDDFQHAVQ